MTFPYEGHTYRVRWEHDPPEMMMALNRCLRRIRVTTCVLTRDETVLATGEAACNLDADQFRKERGRKLSLSRALRTLPIEFRRVVWAQYHGRHQQVPA